MKRRLVILEDNDARFFTTRLVLTHKLKMSLSTLENGDAEAIKRACQRAHIVVSRPAGSLRDLLNYLKARRLNCRNTEVTIIKLNEISEFSTTPFALSVVEKSLKLSQAG